MKKFATIAILSFAFLMQNLSYGQDFEIKWHSSASGTCKQNEDILLTIVLKNNSKEPIYFKVAGGLFDTLGTYMGEYKIYPVVHYNETNIEPWNPDDCENGGGRKLDPKDSLHYIFGFARGCDYGSCEQSMKNYNTSNYSMTFMEEGKTFIAKAMIKSQTGQGKILEKRVRVVKRDDKSFQITDEFFNKRREGYNNARKTGIHYDEEIKLSQFLDTCSNSNAYDNLIISKIPYRQSTLGNAEFFKKYMLRVSDKTKLKFVLEDFVSETTYNNETLSIDKFQLYQYVIKYLKKNDKQLAYNFYVQVNSKNEGFDRLTRCNDKYLPERNLLNNEQLTLLKKLLKK